MNEYEKVRIEFLEKQLYKCVDFVKFIKEHYHHAYMDAKINGRIDVSLMDELIKNDTK